jgi:hypothetical protein
VVRWKERQFLKKQAREMALENWSLISEVVCIWTEARRNVAKEFISNIFEISNHSVLPKLIKARKEARRAAKKEAEERRKGKGKKQGSSKQLLSSSGRVKSEKKLQKTPTKKNILKSEKSFLHFFLTEFDRNDEDKLHGDGEENEEEGEEASVYTGRNTYYEDDDTSSLASGIDYQSTVSVEDLEKDLTTFSKFTNNFRTALLSSSVATGGLAPDSSSSNLHKGNLPNIQQSSRYLSAIPSSFLAVSKKKHYDLHDQRTQQLFVKHQRILQEMEMEEQRRQVALERVKQLQEEKEARKKEDDEKRKEMREKQRIEFQKKLEEECKQRNLLLAKLKEVKRKKALEEEKTAKELKAMAKEDFLLIQKKEKEVQLQRKRLLSAKAKQQAAKRKQLCTTCLCMLSLLFCFSCFRRITSSCCTDCTGECSCHCSSSCSSFPSFVETEGNQA